MFWCTIYFQLYRLHVKCLCSKCIICCKIVMSFMIALYPAWASWSPSVPRERLLLIVSVDPTLWIRARVLESLYFILPHEFYKHLHKNVLLNIIYIYIDFFLSKLRTAKIHNEVFCQLPLEVKQSEQGVVK